MKLKYIFLAAFVFRLLVAPLAWHIDVMNHLDWGERFFEYGINGFYAPDSNVWNFTWPNQPPGTAYIFAGTYLAFQGIFSTLWSINTTIPVFPSIIVTLAEGYLYPVLVKLPAILSDLGIAYLIYKFLSDWKDKKIAKFGAILFLFNPVIWYNSSVWGQTDATISFFVLLSIYLIFKNKLKLSLLAFVMSLYIKFSLIIFAPIYALLLIKKFKIKSILQSDFFLSMRPIPFVLLC